MQVKERIEMLLEVTESMIGTAANEIEEARIDGQIRAYKEALAQFEEGEKMYQVKYSVNITKKDIIRAKKAYEQRTHAMGYIDPIRFMIVEHYLSHFSTESVNTKDILEQSLVNSIITQDSYLRMLKNPETLIPESFDEVCDFIGSIPSDNTQNTNANFFRQEVTAK